MAEEHKDRERRRAGPGRYPAVDRTDAVEPCGERIPIEARSFEAPEDARAQDGPGWFGPRGDPAEGKR
jgi:hypothetical protein